MDFVINKYYFEITQINIFIPIILFKQYYMKYKKILHTVQLGTCDNVGTVIQMRKFI